MCHESLSLHVPTYRITILFIRYIDQFDVINQSHTNIYNKNMSKLKTKVNKQPKKNAINR